MSAICRPSWELGSTDLEMALSRLGGVLAAGILAEAAVGAALGGENLDRLGDVAGLAEVAELGREGTGAEGEHEPRDALDGSQEGARGGRGR
jgi:hypothetical protein